MSTEANNCVASNAVWPFHHCLTDRADVTSVRELRSSADHL